MGISEVLRRIRRFAVARPPADPSVPPPAERLPVAADVYLLAMFLLSSTYLLSDPDHRTFWAYVAVSATGAGVGAGIVLRKGLWNIAEINHGRAEAGG